MPTGAAASARRRCPRSNVSSLNPSSPALDYALYLRGVINFNDDIGVMGSLAGQDLAERDQRASRDAHQAFKQLVDQFPDSAYAEDARARMNYITNSLADYELHVARYYFRPSWRRPTSAAGAGRISGCTGYRRSLVHHGAELRPTRFDTLRDDANRVFQKNFPNSSFPSQGVRKTSKAWWHIWN
jgi:outer membrane protein assembly factor BamD